ncbi:MAG: Protease 4 [Burkholderia sp.]|jgi:protease IV
MKAFLKACYNAFDAFRRLIANLLFLIVLIAAAAFCIWALSSPAIEEGSVLSVEIRGPLSESLPDDASSALLSYAGDDAESGTRLRDVLDAFKYAASDPRIAGVELRLGMMGSAGAASVREVGEAIDRFRRESGKEVWVWSDAYTQAQYLIAAHADHVGLHPMGSAGLRGMSATQLYWGGFLKSLGLEVDVRKAGAYKSAPEVLIADAPSEASLTAQKSYMGAAWNGVTSQLERRRGLFAGSVRTFLEELPKKVDSEHTLAQAYLQRGLVDALETQDAYEEKLGFKYAATHKYKDVKFVDMGTFLAEHPEDTLAAPGVAVVIAEGEIGSGTEFGLRPEAVAAALDSLADDTNVKALVLRINSPGGDANAAEQIRESVLKFKRTRAVPVVVSMGDMAASGGFWIATAGDRIVADPLSVTGSIGVFALSFHAEGLRERFGVGRGGWRTGELADMTNPAAAPSEAVYALVDAGVRQTYSRFKALVGEARKMKPEDVEKVAQGRVWMGSQAAELGLVDKTGGYGDAIAEAAKMAGLGKDAPAEVVETVTQSWRSALKKLAGGAIAGPGAETLLKEKQSFDGAVKLSGRPLAWAPSVPSL